MIALLIPLINGNPSSIRFCSKPSATGGGLLIGKHTVSIIIVNENRKSAGLLGAKYITLKKKEDTEKSLTDIYGTETTWPEDDA